MVSYKSLSGAARRDRLEWMYRQGVPVTAQSAAAVRTLLQGAVTDDERIVLVRILGSLYTEEDATGYNADILLDLRALANDANKEVAHAAVSTFAGIGYLPGSDALLKDAFDHQLLDPPAYSREMLRLMATAPADAWAGMLDRLPAQSGMSVADTLIVPLQQDPALLKKYASANLGRLRQFIEKNEPVFLDAPDQFDLNLATRYANWLRALACIESQRSGMAVDDVLVGTLSMPGTDGRKVIAYLLSPEATPLLRSAHADSPAAGLVDIVGRYAAQYPGSMPLQQAAMVVTHGAVPPRGKSR
ncbi:hypothetical protein [Variovorax sp. PBL-E5]|uniref:hypothetical protein n=1 Tax=Variovorax sp. PBL-E5 TaxID=434014 RepID=UPI001315C516|nr:hypothetical protein [Variovorax sp. PBL-E5]VTU19275.1 hypothetical protein E5CHR_00754 [Variovorax sp. PBL-E5]